MDVYVYHAAFLCEDCGEQVKADLDAIDAEDTGESDDYPQGPHADGGGESDSPAHCDHCGEFLMNPLTDAGIEYVKAAIERGGGANLTEWIAFYDIPADENDAPDNE